VPYLPCNSTSYEDTGHETLELATQSSSSRTEDVQDAGSSAEHFAIINLLLVSVILSGMVDSFQPEQLGLGLCLLPHRYPEGAGSS
jgi:hypothetical protein